MDGVFTRRGFLPEPDPLTAFPPGSEFAVLDEIGRDLPSLLEDRGFRQYARTLSIPPGRRPQAGSRIPRRCGFTTCAWASWPPPTSIRQAKSRCGCCPQTSRSPLVGASRLLGRPPILSYDGYARYNWKRFRDGGPIALGNIDTIQNFVHLYDEHWFILVHVEIEAMPPVRELAERDTFNALLDAIASFREVHYGWAQQYVRNWVAEGPRGTGGTPYMTWLKQLIDETREWQIA